MFEDIEFPDARLAFYDEGGQCRPVRQGEFLQMVEGAIAQLERVSGEGERIGLIYRTGPALLAFWFAAMTAGRPPLIMPGRGAKPLKNYWTGVRSMLAACAIRHLIIDPAILGEAREGPMATGMWRVHEIDPAEVTDAPRRNGGLVALFGRKPKLAKLVLSSGARFLQQPFGARGLHRAVEHKLRDVADHVRDFNPCVSMTADDCVVSWLPLYQDVGFVGGFLMPMMLGAKLALVDSADWEARKDVLLDMIQAEGGTICFMPNWGFEAMSGVDCPVTPSSMRLWVSCAEASRRSSLERFAARFQTPADSMAVCYAMAENVCAVTFRRGIQAQAADDAEAVSCGPPIPGVEVDVINGEIFVRSAYAVRAYVGTGSIREQDGSFNTRDTGAWVGGELYLTNGGAQVPSWSEHRSPHGRDGGGHGSSSGLAMSRPAVARANVANVGGAHADWVGQSQAGGAGEGWYRGDHVNLYPKTRPLAERQTIDAIDNDVLLGWMPQHPFLTKNHLVTAFGSCFAYHLERYLRTRGFKTSISTYGTETSNYWTHSLIIKCGEGFVNTFSIRTQFEWIFDDAMPEVSIWHKSEGRIKEYIDTNKSATAEIFNNTDLFVITLGLSEVWYEKDSGKVLWTGVPQSHYSEEKYGFRLTTVAENLENLNRIVDLVRRERGDTPIVFTLSPVPLNATFRPVSCVSANSVSKAILRVAVDELMRQRHDDANLYYFPSFELITQYLPDTWQEDHMHPRWEAVDLIMRAFVQHYAGE